MPSDTRSISKEDNTVVCKANATKTPSGMTDPPQPRTPLGIGVGVEGGRERVRDEERRLHLLLSSPCSMVLGDRGGRRRNIMTHTVRHASQIGQRQEVE